jgi:hypothetical protein
MPKTEVETDDAKQEYGELIAEDAASAPQDSLAVSEDLPRKPAWGYRRSRGVPANTLPAVGPESVDGLGIAEIRPCASVGL